MSSNNVSRDHVKHSEPIAINTSTRRDRSASVSSGSSSSASSAGVQTPASPGVSQRINIPSPGSSPILSYFLAQSPTTKTPGTGTFPFSRKLGPPPVFEEDEEALSTVQPRRSSTIIPGRFAQPHNSLPESQSERGSGLLRRLSLSSGAFAKPVHEGQPTRSFSPPSPPPPSAVNPTSRNLPFARENKPRRSATVTEGARPRRAPSPMGERILKGHFDGFN